MAKRKKAEQPEAQPVTETVAPPPDVLDLAITDHQAAQVVTHAEKVKRKAGYTNQGISDYEIGARLHEYQNSETKEYLSIIKLDKKPENKAVPKLLRDSGFDFDYDKEEWHRPIRFETRQADRLDAERVFKKACEMIREEQGIGQGVA